MKVINGGTQRKYYKYGTQLNDQIIQTGGTYNPPLYTSAPNSYLSLPNLDFNNANSFEFQTSFTFGGNNVCPSIISPSTPDYGFQLQVYNNNLEICLSYGGTAETLIIGGTVVLQNLVSGTTYYIKSGYNGSQYYFSYNTNGSDTYTTTWTLNSNRKVYSAVPYILGNWGYNLTSVYYCDFPINMANTKIYINGDLYLAGTQAEAATESDYDFYEDVDVREVVSEENNGIATYYAVRNY